MNSLPHETARSRYRGPMRAKSRFLVTFTSATLIVGGLTGCAPESSPEPTPTATIAAKPKATSTPTPTPTVAAGPVAARIQLDGDSVTVQAADASTILDIPFTTDAATAANQLGAAVGLDATITTTAGGLCAADTTHYAWGGFQFHSPGGYAMAPGATFVASSLAPTTSNGLPVVMPSGQGVGTPTTEVLAANPGVPAEGDPASDSVVYFDVLSGHPLGDMDTFYGAEALANGGFITSLVSPIHYYYDC